MKSSDKEEIEKEMLKEAGIGKLLATIAGHLGFGAAYAKLLDWTAHGDDPESKWTAERKGQFLLNTLLGTGSSSAGHGAYFFAKGRKAVKAAKGIKAVSAIKPNAALSGTLGAASLTGLGLAPAKNAAESVAGNFRRATDALEAQGKSQKELAENLKGIVDATKENEGGGALPWVLGGLGVAGLGLGGYGLYKWLKKEDKSQSKMRIKLPGVQGDPNSGAEVEVPINPAKISPGLMSRINSTVLRRTRSNVRYAAKKVDPETGKKIPYEEWVMKYGDQDERDALRQELSETGDQQDEIAGMLGELEQPLPPGDPRLKEASYIPAGFASALRKAADFSYVEKKASDTREGHEFLGSTLSSFPSSILSALGGAYLAESHGVSPIVGRVIGGGLGAFLPAVIGGGLAQITGDRTPEEQAEHDAETPWMEYVIPGYATYQLNKRNQAERIEKERIKDKIREALSKGSFEATGQKIPPSFVDGELSPMALPVDELVDIKKAAGMLGAPPPMMGPPPPPMPPAGGMMGPPPMMGGMPPAPMGPPPVSPQQTRQVDPNQNLPGREINRPAKTDDIRRKAQSADRQTQLAVSKRVFETIPSQRPQGIQGIRSTMAGVGERVRNIRANRFNRDER